MSWRPRMRLNFRGLRPRPVQDRDLQLLRRQLAVAAVGVPAERLHRERQRLRKRHPVAVPLVEVAADLVGVAADGDRPVLVDDGAVVRQPVDLVVLGRGAHLRDDQLHLVRLLADAGEDRAERLGVDVGQRRAVTSSRS